MRSVKRRWIVLRHWILLLGIGIAELTHAAAVLADTFFLANGDRITGKIIKKDKENLLIETSYSPTMILKWGELRALKTSGPVYVKLVSGEIVHAPLSIDSDKASLSMGDGRLIIKDVKDIVEVSATPTEVANGHAQNKVASKNKNTPEVDASKSQGSLHKGLVKLAASVTSGNTEVEHINFDAETTWRWDRNRVVGGLTLNNAQENDRESLDNTKLLLKYDRFSTEKLYWNANTTFFQDKFKDLDLRTSAGLGVGYEFWVEPRRNLSVESGINYVNENFLSKNDSDYAAFRWNLKFDHLLYRGPAKFFHKHEGLVNLSDSENLKINAQTGVSVPIGKQLEVSTQLNVDFDNVPTLGKEQTDLQYLIGIGYHW